MEADKWRNKFLMGLADLYKVSSALVDELWEEWKQEKGLQAVPTRSVIGSFIDAKFSRMERLFSENPQSPWFRDNRAFIIAHHAKYAPGSEFAQSVDDIYSKLSENLSDCEQIKELIENDLTEDLTWPAFSPDIRTFLNRLLRPAPSRALDVHTMAASVFKPEFHDPNRNLSILESYVAQVIDHQGDEYLPYIAITQSSGYGKTRLALELRRSFVEFYICLRNPSIRSADPSTTHSAGTYLRGLRKYTEFVHFFRALFDCAASYLEQISRTCRNTNTYIDAKEVFADLMNPNSHDHNGFWEAVTMSAQKNVTSEAGLVDATSNSPPRGLAATKMLPRLHDALNSSFDSFTAVLTQHGRPSPTSSSSEAPPFPGVVVVLDEARVFCDDVNREGDKDVPFRNLRACFYALAPKRLACIVMDTSSRITNFLPTEDADASRKSYSLCIRPVFCYVTTHGVLPLLRSPERMVNEWLTIDGPRCYFHPLLLASRSRAVFGSIINAVAKDVNLDTCWSIVKKFCTFKLCNDKNPSKSRLVLLALAAAKFCILPVKLEDSSELVGSHLATLLRQSTDGATIAVSYVAEPMVGESASELLKDNFVATIKLIAEERLSGSIGRLYSQGDVGEFAAAVILSRCFDVLVERYRKNNSADRIRNLYALPINAAKFLGLLGGFDTSTVELERLQESVVSFAQFVESGRSITTKMLLQAFHRRVAFFCRPGEYAVDIVIPMVWCSREEGCNVADYMPDDVDGSPALPLNTRPIAEEDMGAIVCQVKNFSFSAKLSEPAVRSMFGTLDVVATEMLAANSQAPRAALVINVGKSATKRHSIQGPSIARVDDAHSVHLFLPLLDNTSYRHFMTEEELQEVQKLAVHRKRADDYIERLAENVGRSSIAMHCFEEKMAMFTAQEEMDDMSNTLVSDPTVPPLEPALIVASTPVAATSSVPHNITEPVPEPESEPQPQPQSQPESQRKTKRRKP